VTLLLLASVAGCTTPDARDGSPEVAEGPTPRLVGDLDGDGRDEAVIELSGSEADRVKVMWGLYRRDGADLVPVQVRGEGPFRFTIGDGTRSRDGLWCRDVLGAPGIEMIVVSVQERSGSPWVKRIYRWVGRDLTLDAKREGALDEGRPSAHLLDKSLAIRCGPFDSRAASD
jgi:hypothetical protein